MLRGLALRVKAPQGLYTIPRGTASASSLSDGYYILLPAITPDTPETNPIMRTDRLPEFDKISNEQVSTGLSKLTIDYETSFYRLEEEILKSKNQRTFATLFNSLDKLNHGLVHAFTTAQTLNLTRKSHHLEDIVARSQKPVSRCGALANTSQTILRTLKEIQAEQKNLTEAQNRVLSKYLLECKLNGMDLSSKHHRQYLATMIALRETQDKFRSNFLQSSKSFNPPVVSPMSFDELPQDLARKVFTSADGTPRSPFLSLKNPMYDTFMEYCSDRECRKLAYTARSTRAAFQNPDTNNSLVIEDIRQHRAKEAQLLGFENYAALSMETKMAGSVNNVLTVFSEMTIPAKTKCQEELESLQKFANDGRLKGEIQLWDIAYWKRRQQSALYQLNPNDIATYFPFPEVWNRLIRLCTELFGVKIKKSATKPPVWHKDVEFYQVFDQDGTELAGFYLDAFARPSDKHHQAQFLPLQNRSTAANALPLATLLFSFQQPTDKCPSLLSFEDLNSLFQKFGAALQHLLTTVPYGDASGINNIEWDALDISGNFFRMLLQSPEILQSLSKNVKTGQQISGDGIERIYKSERHMSSLGLLSAMYFGMLDLMLYSKFDFWEDVMKDVWRDFMPFALPKGDAHPCSMAQIFIGSYPAAFYSFLWAEMVASDVFTTFKTAGFSDQKKMSQIGHKFRETFLSLGGGCHAAEVFRRFSGRDPSYQSLLKFQEII